MNRSGWKRNETRKKQANVFKLGRDICPKFKYRYNEWCCFWIKYQLSLFNQLWPKCSKNYHDSAPLTCLWWKFKRASQHQYFECQLYNPLPVCNLTITDSFDRKFSCSTSPPRRRHSSFTNKSLHSLLEERLITYLDIIFKDVASRSWYIRNSMGCHKTSHI